MNERKSLPLPYLSFPEICIRTSAPEEMMIQIVEHGIVEPVGTAPEEWQFSSAMLLLTRKAVRLHRDLEVDWAGVALAIELLERVEQLKSENRYLKQQLGRFIDR